MSDVIWRRLAYMLSPQLDLYKSIARQVEGKKVLEVGFGTGFGTLQLARRALEVTAVEKDPDAVQFAKTCLPLSNVAWLYGDAVNLRGPGFYDAVVMVEVLEHIPEWHKALEQVKTHLWTGGALYLTARNANADLRRNELHERELSAAQLVDALSQHFGQVQLFDYTLTQELGADTRSTPLIARAVK